MKSTALLTILLSFAGLLHAQVSENNEADYYVVVEDMPEFPGGSKAFIKFIYQNLEYPQKAMENNINGTVKVHFIVNTDGSISDVKIAEGVHELIDQEAIRIFKAMPDWTPGRQNGELVRVGYKVPVYFNIPDENEPPADYTKLNIMPEFPGGEKAMYTFIAENIIYPDTALENRIEGTVYVRFVVDCYGFVTNPEVARGVNLQLDTEAIRVIKSMPKWYPGYQNWRPVALEYTIPVRISIDKRSRKK